MTYLHCKMLASCLECMSDSQTSGLQTTQAPLQLLEQLLEQGLLQRALEEQQQSSGLLRQLLQGQGPQKVLVQSQRKALVRVQRKHL